MFTSYSIVSLSVKCSGGVSPPEYIHVNTKLALYWIPGQARNDNSGSFIQKTPVLVWSRCFFYSLRDVLLKRVIRRNGYCQGSCNFSLTNCLMKSMVPSIPNTDESIHKW